MKRPKASLLKPGDRSKFYSSDSVIKEVKEQNFEIVKPLHVWNNYVILSIEGKEGNFRMSFPSFISACLNYGLNPRGINKWPIKVSGEFVLIVQDTEKT